jgi:methylenetetrahydrofolate reductase (NADPH)
MTTTPTWGNVAVERLAECPKTMTNGPCGGVAADGACEVDRRKLCVWYEAIHLSPAQEVFRRLPAADWSQPGVAFGRQTLSGNGASALAEAQALPDKTDRPLRSAGRFEQVLRSGRFAVTCEINPPDSADAAAQLQRVQALRGLVDAVHISDNSLASPHMCGLALAGLIERLGLETILHMTCRDRNRLMLQADVLGAAALGVKNVLCLTGDHPSIGDHPQAKPVFDLDAITFIEAVRRLRDDEAFESGRVLQAAPRVLIGGGAEPTSPPYDFRPVRLAKKIAAGLDFAVTQVIFDMERLRQYLHQVRDLGLDRKIYLLVSVGALGGPGMARGMNANTPGVSVPESVIHRLEKTPKAQRRAEGVKICIEQIQELLQMPGVNGIDLMDIEPERYIEIVEAAGLEDRPLAAGPR